MLNFRKIRQDFSSNILRDGKEMFDEKKVLSAKIRYLDSKVLRIGGVVKGQYENHYECEVEIDRQECEMIDSNCDCPYNCDCSHLAALLFHLEQHSDEILVSFSKETDLETMGDEDLAQEEKLELLEKVKKAESMAEQKQEGLYQTQVLQEYIAAADILATSPFFRPQEKHEIDRAEFLLLFSPAQEGGKVARIDVQVALRLPFRSKPLYVPHLKEFFRALRYGQPLFMGGRRYCFSLLSFDEEQRGTVQMVMDHLFYQQGTTEKNQRIGGLPGEVFGVIVGKAHAVAAQKLHAQGYAQNDEDPPRLKGFYLGSLEAPLAHSLAPISFRFVLEYLPPPVSKILLNPRLQAGKEELSLEDVHWLECMIPGVLYGSTYYPLPATTTPSHLSGLPMIRDLTIPEPLFGSFIENALPELMRHAKVASGPFLEELTTLPFGEKVKATCDLSFLDGELEAALSFHYGEQTVLAAPSKLSYQEIFSFVTKEGVLARNLVEERKLVEELFQDFLYNTELGIYVTRSEKKIVEFMTDTIPRLQDQVKFNCPQNLLDQVIYDDTTFALSLQHCENRVDAYELELKVKGPLRRVRTDLLWECIAAKKAFIELETVQTGTKKGGDAGKLPKILVLDLVKIGQLVQVLDELGIDLIDNQKIERPLWSLASLDADSFAQLPVAFSISDQLLEIRKQMLGETTLPFSALPSDLNAKLRSYQVEGVHWLERLRGMYLNGILADDMGLGKTLQAIVAITQQQSALKGVSLIVCPTTLLYNWKEEFAKFNPTLKVEVVEGVPQQRKKMIEKATDVDILVTSYTLLQKDVDLYRATCFSYVILDEAQHIKNRGTRNAKSVKQIKARHRLILSGTPIENSLDELWSLFDFLMPGFLNSYDRFVEKYIRPAGEEQLKNLEYLRRKMSPFIMRRMKADVLDDLPPVSEILYHCQLTDSQHELYRSYAQSARDELVRLVERDGFDRVQIHVLATLTRLKQICCHPAIFAKETAEPGDSAKYDMLVDLLQSLIEGKHKTVIFSQYTRMLQIMREDFTQKGIPFLYLDGSSKNRLEIVRDFNEDDQIPVFLVSLKAGGTGLNLVSADTVIHYDMWWNPAVENQATDRVHRMGQKRSVSAYKLITLGTIEEKIAEMQKRKKGLVKKVVSCDDEVISKLTWEDVLELLKT